MKNHRNEVTDRDANGPVVHGAEPPGNPGQVEVDERLEAERTELDAARIAELEAEVADLRGPHCTGCGQSIDPDYCHCGDRMDSPPDSHAHIPAGCICGYVEQDWEHRSHQLSQLCRRQRARIAELEAENARLRNELAEISFNKMRRAALRGKGERG